MHTNIKFTYPERKLIEKFLKREYSCSAISKEMGRSKNGIVFEVRRNGGKLKYCAKQAQAESDKRAEEKGLANSLRQKGKPVGSYKQIIVRIENIEMQLDILFQKLEELLNDKQNKKL